MSPACFAQQEERKQKVKDASTLPTLPPLWCFDSLEVVDQVYQPFQKQGATSWVLINAKGLGLMI